MIQNRLIFSSNKTKKHITIKYWQINVENDKENNLEFVDLSAICLVMRAFNAIHKNGIKTIGHTNNWSLGNTFTDKASGSFVKIFVKKIL